MPPTALRRPVVGIIGNMNLLNENYPVHAGGTMNSEAVAKVAGCLPLIIPSDPHYVTVDELLELCDGFLLTGGRPNVHPSEYGEAETPHMVISTAAAMRSPCRWCGPAWSGASRSSAFAAAFKR